MNNCKLIWLTLAFAGVSLSQQMPDDYAGVLKALGKQGDFKTNVL